MTAALRALLVVTTLSIGTSARQGADAVSYHFSYSQTGATTAQIEISLPTPLTSPGVLVMPRAIPMGYGEQYYDAFVGDVRARSADKRELTVDAPRRATLVTGDWHFHRLLHGRPEAHGTGGARRVGQLARP